MADYYADFDLVGGANDGGADGAANDPTDANNWTNAWKTMADVMAGSNGVAPAAGDIVYCQGTDTLGADVATSASGTVGGGFIKFVGCADGVGGIDGTQVLIDCNAGAYSFQVAHNFLWFENIRITNSTTNGFEATGSVSNTVWINCQADNCNGYGFEVGFSYSLFIRCIAFSCVNGFQNYINNHYLFCVARDNTAAGWDDAAAPYGSHIHCVMHDNGAEGINSKAGGLLYGCVVNKNATKGIETNPATYVPYLVGNRITNHSGVGDTGIDFNSEVGVYGWNFLDNNTDHYLNEALAIAIVNDDQSATNVAVNEGGAGGGDTNQGYTNIGAGTEDFNLRSDATLRRTAIPLPPMT